MSEYIIEGFPVPYQLPPQPKLKDISGSNLSKKNQKWIRPVLPTDKEAALLTKEERKALIERELIRRIDGFWFMNNGEPTYITGATYFYLTYWYIAANTKDRYPEYRSALREWFYVIDICVKDPNCFGAIMITQKRFGKTEMALAELYNSATLLDEDCLFGMQAITSMEAKNNLFKSRVMRSHKKIPNYLKPASNESIGTKEIVSELTFLGEKEAGGTYKRGLDNVIDHRPTTTSAYQGKKPKRIFFDELPAVDELDVAEWWSTVREQLALGTDLIFGKAFMPATLETMDKKGAPEYQKLWKDSDYNERDANGRTRSGLYRYLKPYYKGREGCIDEYGNDIIEKAKQFRQNQLDNADEKGAIKIKNQYPENEDDAFGLKNLSSPFDIPKIVAQIKFNDMNPQLVKRGNFEWKNGVKFSTVEWHPNANGLFNITWMPAPERCNHVMWKGGKPAPGNEMEGNFGLDSFSHRNPTAKGSNAALYGVQMPTVASPSPFFFLEYIHRARTPELQAEDVLKACIFYGMSVLGESNKPAVMNYFYLHGYEHYLMDRPYETHTEYSAGRQKEKWIPNVSEEVRGTLVGYAVTYVYHHVGINDETGMVGKCYFNTLLEDLKEFNPENKWTKFDAFVGAVFALAGLRRFIPKKPSQKYIPMIPTYNNSGMRSTLMTGKNGVRQ